jgi:hypothetical protein
MTFMGYLYSMDFGQVAAHEGINEFRWRAGLPEQLVRFRIYLPEDLAVMADVISGNGRIVLDGGGVEDTVFYWLTISDEPGELVAEGSITASEDLLRKLKKAERATLALEDGPPLVLKCEGGRNGVRWVKALRDDVEPTGL